MGSSRRPGRIRQQDRLLREGRSLGCYRANRGGRYFRISIASERGGLLNEGVEPPRLRAVWREAVKVAPACRSGPVRRGFFVRVDHHRRFPGSMLIVSDVLLL